MRNRDRGVLAAAAVGMLLLAGGCVDRSVSGDTITYDYSWWVPVVVLLSAAVALPAGLALRGRSRRAGVGLLVLAPVLGIIVFPAMILDKVKVDSDHFETHYGIWFAPSTHNVRFDDLSELRLVTYQERTRRGGRTTKQKFVCVHKSDAPQDTVHLGTLVKQAAPEILKRAAEHGVALTEGGQ
jgi:hypothetical protein